MLASGGLSMAIARTGDGDDMLDCLAKLASSSAIDTTDMNSNNVLLQPFLPLLRCETAGDAILDDALDLVSVPFHTSKAMPETPTLNMTVGVTLEV